MFKSILKFDLRYILSILVLASLVNAKKNLYSNSLVNCMKNNTDIIPTYFNVIFDGEDRSITYDISLTAKIQGKLKAYATVYAFGFNIIHESIDLCKLNLKQFCPITPSEMEVYSIQYISQHYVDMIPDIAYTFPNLDAIARLIITDEDDNLLGCLQASFDNGKTVSHEGAKWATAVVAGIGLLISGLLSVFGNSASAARMSAAALSLFTYFQSVVIVTMLSVEEVPPIANAWAENLAWSMGLIRIEFMQEIFRWYVQATGGTPTQYLTSGVKEILTQRSIDDVTKNSYLNSLISFFLPAFKPKSYSHDYLNDYSSSLIKRDSDTDPRYFYPLNHVETNDYLQVLRGIDRIGYNANIEPTSVVCTGFTFFILCLYVLVAIFFIYRYLSNVLTKSERKNFIGQKLEYRNSWKPTLKGMLLRYLYIGYPQLLILSLWEFTVQDSGAVITLAVLFLILSLGTLSFACFQVLRYGNLSVKEHSNPAAILYGNPEILSRYGFLYTTLNAHKFWFCAVTLVYIFVKSMFVGLSQSSGKTQALALWIIDMIYLGLMCHFLPYLDRFTNVLSIFIQLITTINSFFFTFFSSVFGQPFRVASVMGLVFFIMNAAVSLLLLIVILILALFTIFSKNPDAKFSQTKDDRTSFQRKHQSIGDGSTDELFELGAVAKEHGDNWATDIYNIRDTEPKSSSGDLLESPDIDGTNSNTDTKLYSTETVSDQNQNQKGFGKFVDKLTRGKSLLGLSKTRSNTELPTPANLLNTRSHLSGENNNDAVSTNLLDDVSTAHDHIIEDASVLHEDNNNPFGSSRNLAIENPFENSPSNTPYQHTRNESHISGVTNGTGGGLSVFGERINSSDYMNDHINNGNTKLGLGAHSGLNQSQYVTSPVDEIGERTSFEDDIDSEESDSAHRRF